MVSLSAERGRAATVPENAVAAVLGLWMIVGLYSDGWAHLNRPALESFFTPWHGVLYSGFVLSAAWVAWLGWRHKWPGRSWFAAFPPGYGLGAVGVLVFAAGGAGDMLWHIVFGVEAGLDALVSPTHLVLLVGGMLLLTSPVRAVQDEATSRWPAVVALGSATALAGFFLSYVSVFAQPLATMPLTTIPEGMPGHQQAELPAGAGLAGYLVITAALVVPLLLYARDGRPGAGSVTVVVALVALPGAALTSFRFGAAAVAAVVGALLVDLIRARARQMGPRGLAVLLPAVVWPAQLLGLDLAQGVRWPVELWFGVVVLTALAGFVLASLVWRPVSTALTG